jgi:hypothetical protein
MNDTQRAPWLTQELELELITGGMWADMAAVIADTYMACGLQAVDDDCRADVRAALTRLKLRAEEKPE